MTLAQEISQLTRSLSQLRDGAGLPQELAENVQAQITRLQHVMSQPRPESVSSNVWEMYRTIVTNAQGRYNNIINPPSQTTYDHPTTYRGGSPLKTIMGVGIAGLIFVGGLATLSLALREVIR